jgi:hypothetical protein
VPGIAGSKKNIARGINAKPLNLVDILPSCAPCVQLLALAGAIPIHLHTNQWLVFHHSMCVLVQGMQQNVFQRTYHYRLSTSDAEVCQRETYKRVGENAMERRAATAATPSPHSLTRIFFSTKHPQTS